MRCARHRRAGHGRGRGRLPAGPGRRAEDRARRRRPDARSSSRLATSSPRPCRGPRRRPAAGRRRFCRRDRLARARHRERPRARASTCWSPMTSPRRARASGRTPTGSPWSCPAARRAVAHDVQARGRRPAVGPCRRPFAPRPGLDAWCSIGSHDECHRPGPRRLTDRRHHQALRRRPALRDADRLRLPHGRWSTRQAYRSSSSATRSRRDAGLRERDPVTMTEMLHHTGGRGARRGTRRHRRRHAFLSYASPEEAVDNAGRFLQEAGAQAVKLEGGVRSARAIEAVVKAGIPVMGHIGWTPQSKHALGGKVRVQGKTAIGPVPSSPTRWRSRRRALSRWSWSSSRISSRGRSLSDCRSRPSASAPGRAARRRSRWSPTCWAVRTGIPDTPSRSPICAARSSRRSTEYMAEVAGGHLPGSRADRGDGRATLDEVLGRCCSTGHRA